MSEQPPDESPPAIIMAAKAVVLSTKLDKIIVEKAHRNLHENKSETKMVTEYFMFMIIMEHLRYQSN